MANTNFPANDDDAARRLIDAAAGYVRQTLQGDSSGHDWWHVWRVWQTSIRIGRIEGADLLVVQLAALLHDIADWKFHGGDETAGPRVAREWMAQQRVAAQTIDHVCDIIAHLSFKGAGVASQMTTLEGQVVQDADRLDAVGAVGIGRAFAYGGHAGRPMYDPAILPEQHATFEAYKKNSGPTINHFYEKLLLLKDRMNTATARQLAADRHAFMEEFLRRFYDEWNADCIPAITQSQSKLATSLQEQITSNVSRFDLRP
jgi:uncharacterized protein